MAIKFICSCGKHLRAREEMAARRSVCPRCGAPVGIPSLHPTHTGTVAAPLTPDERRRLRRNAGSAGADSFTAAPPAPVPPRPDAERPRRRRGRLHLETHWYQCLLYSLQPGRLLLVLGLALALAAATGVLLTVLPEVWGPGASLRQRRVFWAVGTVFSLILVYTCAALQGPLVTALAGQAPYVHWPVRDVLFALKSCLRCVVCFLAGPGVLAGIAFWYWLYGGDLVVLDWVILVELVVLAVGYGFLVVTASAETGRLRDANPVRVARLVQRLGRRAIVPVLVAPLLMIGHGLVAITAAGFLHTGIFGVAPLVSEVSVLTGSAGLVCAWAGALFWATFFFRLLGVWCCRMNAAAPPPAEVPAPAVRPACGRG